MQSPPARSPASRRLKLLTYNVHSCIGTDRRLAPERVAEVIAAAQPDIIGLQELDVGRRRTGGIDQAHTIAEILKMKHHFHAALDVEEERYGDIWRRLINDVARDGVLRPDLDLYIAQMLVLGALNWAVEWWNPRRSSVEAVVENAQSIIRYGIADAAHR